MDINCLLTYASILSSQLLISCFIMLKLCVQTNCRWANVASSACQDQMQMCQVQRVKTNNVCISISIADPLGVLIKCFNRMFKPRGAFAFGPFLVTWCYSCFVPIYAWSNLPWYLLKLCHGFVSLWIALYSHLSLRGECWCVQSEVCYNIGQYWFACDVLELGAGLPASNRGREING